jgi:ATP-binding cassette subfamily B protein
MLIAAAIMLWYDWILFMVVLAMAPGLWLISQFFRGRLSHTWRNVQESFSRVTAALAESVNGIRVTQGFVRQDRNAEQFRDLVQNHSDHHLQAAQLTGVFLPLLEWNSQFFISILLLLGGYQVLAGGMLANTDPNAQFESLVVFFFMVNLFFSPITVIGKQYNMALTAMAGAERVFALLDTKPQQLDRPDAIPIPMIRGRVEFANVCFAYEPETQVLTDINFIAKPGQTIAMVGPTGSGKSTIIKLVSKFYLPTSGQILIDSNGLHQIRGSSYVKQLGIVLQQNFLFTGTVYDNIRVGKISATDNDVRNAARRLDCLDLIQSLPSGFNTEVGEAGGNLSLGQRQLVCFCRAMLADPRILILDEATSSVDTMTESRIQRALAVLLSDRTSFVVAHRMSTIRHADKVLVLNEGKIVERGTHTHLLTTDGLYAKLYRQFIHTTDM